MRANYICEKRRILFIRIALDHKFCIINQNIMEKHSKELIINATINGKEKIVDDLSDELLLNGNHVNHKNKDRVR